MACVFLSHFSPHWHCAAASIGQVPLLVTVVGEDDGLVYAAGAAPAGFHSGSLVKVSLTLACPLPGRLTVRLSGPKAMGLRLHGMTLTASTSTSSPSLGHPVPGSVPPTLPLGLLWACATAFPAVVAAHVASRSVAVTALVSGLIPYVEPSCSAAALVRPLVVLLASYSSTVKAWLLTLLSSSDTPGRQRVCGASEPRFVDLGVPLLVVLHSSSVTCFGAQGPLVLV